MPECENPQPCRVSLSQGNKEGRVQAERQDSTNSSKDLVQMSACTLPPLSSKHAFHPARPPQPRLQARPWRCTAWVHILTVPLMTSGTLGKFTQPLRFWAVEWG